MPSPHTLPPASILQHTVRAINNIAPIFKDPSRQVTETPLPPTATLPGFAGNKNANPVSIWHRPVDDIAGPRPPWPSDPAGSDFASLDLTATIGTPILNTFAGQGSSANAPMRREITTMTIGGAPAPISAPTGPRTASDSTPLLAISTGTWTASSVLPSPSATMSSSSGSVSVSVWLGNHAPPTKSTEVSLIGSSVLATSSSVSTGSSPSSTSEPFPDTSSTSTASRLSMGGKIGIGLILGIGIPWLAVFTWYLLLRRREKKQREASRTPNVQWALVDQGVRY